MEEHLMDMARAQKAKLAKGQSRAMELEALRPEQATQELEPMPKPGMSAGLKRVVGRKKGGRKMVGGALVGGAYTDGEFGVINEPSPQDMLGGAKYGAMLGQHLMKQKGSGFFDDFAKGFMSVIRPVASVVKNVAGVIPHPAAQALSGTLGAVGLGKAGAGKRSKCPNCGYVKCRCGDMSGGAFADFLPKQPRTCSMDMSPASIACRKGVPYKKPSFEDMVGKVVKAPIMEGEGGKAKSASDKRKLRGQAVSRLMKEQGMSLGEASRYVKEHGF